MCNKVMEFYDLVMQKSWNLIMVISWQPWRQLYVVRWLRVKKFWKS